MIQGFSGVFITMLCCLLYSGIVKRFCKNYLELSKRNEALFFLLFLCGAAVMEGISQCDFFPAIVLTLSGHILFIGIVLLLFRGDKEKKILAAAILITITTLVENFCTALFSCVTLFWLHIVKGITIPFLGELETAFITYSSLIITIMLLYWASNYFASVFYCKTKRWYAILAVPLLVVTLVIDIANWGASNGILVRSGGDRSLYYDQIFSHAGFCVLSGLSMFAAGVYVFGMNRIYLEQKKSSQYHQQIAAYKMLEEQYRRSERVRHDLKNHILALSGLLEHKEWEKIKGYLKNMEDSAGFQAEEATGNRIVDVLLSQKRKLAEEKNMTWEAEVQIPPLCGINEFDLCVLFGNILDNAVEACERLQHNQPYCETQAFIRIQARAVKQFFLLEVRNSTDTAGQQKTGVTGKENPEEHGIGLLNVRDVVQKYNGTMKIEIENGIFAIVVLVPLSDAVHDMKQAV